MKYQLFCFVFYLLSCCCYCEQLFGTLKDNTYGLEIGGPRRIVISPDGKHAYVTAKTDNAVSWFYINQNTGELSYAGNYVDDTYLKNVRALKITPDGKHVYVVSPEYVESNPSASIVCFLRDANTGNLFLKSMLLSIPYSTHIYDIAISPLGMNVYAVSPSKDTLLTFNRDSHTGKLTYATYDRQDEIFYVEGIQRYTKGLYGAYSVDVSPDRKHVYVASAFQSAVSWFDRNELTGHLIFSDYIDKYKPLMVQSEYVNGISVDFSGLDYATSIKVSPDGKHVYVTAMNDNSISWWNRDNTTGKLTFIDRMKEGSDAVDGLGGAYNLDISADGNYVYVAAKKDNAVSWFTRNNNTGDLTYLGSIKEVEGLHGAVDVAVYANTNVYAVAYDDNAVSWFSINKDVTMQPTPPTSNPPTTAYTLKRIMDKTCAEYNYESIKTRDECLEASATLGVNLHELEKTSVSERYSIYLPTGCFWWRLYENGVFTFATMLNMRGSEVECSTEFECICIARDMSMITSSPTVSDQKYLQLTSGNGCKLNGYTDIKDSYACEQAARDFGYNLPITRIDWDDSKPAGCYLNTVQQGFGFIQRLFVNLNVQSTHSCTSYDRCFCGAPAATQPTESPTIARTNIPTKAPITSSPTSVKQKYIYIQDNSYSMTDRHYNCPIYGDATIMDPTKCAQAAKEVLGLALTVSEIQFRSDRPFGCYNTAVLIGTEYIQRLFVNVNEYSTKPCDTTYKCLCAPNGTHIPNIYIKTVADGNTCPGSSLEYIEDKYTCEKAFHDLGYTQSIHDMITDLDRPKGCYMQTMNSDATPADPPLLFLNFVAPEDVPAGVLYNALCTDSYQCFCADPINPAEPTETPTLLPTLLPTPDVPFVMSNDLSCTALNLNHIRYKRDCIAAVEYLGLSYSDMSIRGNYDRPACFIEFGILVINTAADVQRDLPCKRDGSDMVCLCSSNTMSPTMSPIAYKISNGTSCLDNGLFSITNRNECQQAALPYYGGYAEYESMYYESNTVVDSPFGCYLKYIYPSQYLHRDPTTILNLRADPSSPCTEENQCLCTDQALAATDAPTEAPTSIPTTSSPTSPDAPIVKIFDKTCADHNYNQITTAIACKRAVEFFEPNKELRFTYDVSKTSCYLSSETGDAYFNDAGIETVECHGGDSCLCSANTQTPTISPLAVLKISNEKTCLDYDLSTVKTITLCNEIAKDHEAENLEYEQQVQIVSTPMIPSGCLLTKADPEDDENPFQYPFFRFNTAISTTKCTEEYQCFCVQNAATFSPTNEQTAPTFSPTNEQTAPTFSPTNEQTAPTFSPTNEQTAPTFSPTNEQTAPTFSPTNEPGTPPTLQLLTKSPTTSVTSTSVPSIIMYSGIGLFGACLLSITVYFTIFKNKVGPYNAFDV